MSIYIKGMGMPKSCSDCKIFCGLPYQLRDKKGRRPDCPLVPVPPHGRLIDADEVMERIARDTPLSSTFERITRRYIDTSPTIIEEEAQE